MVVNRKRDSEQMYFDLCFRDWKICPIRKQIQLYIIYFQFNFMLFITINSARSFGWHNSQLDIVIESVYIHNLIKYKRSYNTLHDFKTISTDTAEICQVLDFVDIYVHR